MNTRNKHASDTRTHTATATATTTARGPGFAATALAAAATIALTAVAAPPPARAFGPVSVQLKDIRVEQVACSSGVGSVGGVSFSGASTKAACLNVTAQAVNPDSKPLYNADVFGRVSERLSMCVLLSVCC